MNTRNLTFILATVALFSLGQQCEFDLDRDGVPDSSDGCPNTPLCAVVDETGCPSDDDDDGVVNGCDDCQDTPSDTMVHGTGCEVPQDPDTCQGPDLRAKEIEYSLVNLTDATTADILIKGVVDSIGGTDYQSSTDQQSVQLWEDDNMVAQRQFVNLAIGGTVTVEYQRTWQLEGAEFQPRRYKVLVTFDPDIMLDDNPNNDDCNPDNDILLRGVDGIATLFE